MVFTVDIRIFGVPERMDMIRRNQGLLGLPDDRIVLDPEHNGCLPTAKRCWGLPAEADHVLVLPDDVLLCYHFTDYLERIVRAHPDAVIGLFPIQFPDRRHVSRFPTRSPYVETKTLSGAGILMRADYIEPCLASWHSEGGDDANIQRWAEREGIQVLTTLPAILNHIGFVSIHDPSRSLGCTEFFRADPSDANWDDPYVTPWTNVV